MPTYITSTGKIKHLKYNKAGLAKAKKLKKKGLKVMYR